MIHAFRVTPKMWAKGAFSGEGSKIAGGRWNSKGIAIVYASATLSQAILETLVHLDSLGDLENYVYYKLEIPDSLVEEVRLASLPNDFDSQTDLLVTRKIGDKWVSDGKFAVLKAPSAIVPIEANFMLHPAHQDYGKIIIGDCTDLRIDRRLRLLRR